MQHGGSIPPRSTYMKYRTTKTLSPLDAAYLAGLVDGEGTIALSGPRHRQRNTRHPVISIANTDYNLVQWPLKITGAGFISKKGKKKLSHHLDSYIYAAHSNQALSIIAQIYPYLKNKSKRARAKLLLEEYKEVTPRNGKYSPDLLIKRQRFEEVLFSL